jgi:rhamnosyltransferase
MVAKVAVLLAAYNGRAWIEDQTNSILQQDSVEITLFVSVDRSEDGTEQFVDQLSLSEPRLSILPHGKKFGGAGPNFYRLIQEVDFSGFDYVAYADQDDLWLPNKLSWACEELTKSGADGYSSNVTAFWPDGRQLLVNKSQSQVRWDFLFEAAGPGCTYVISHKLVCELQRFIIQHAQSMQNIALHDWFTYAFARSRGYRWVIDDASFMHYRQHANNQVGVNFGLRAFISRFKKILGGWGFAQAFLIADTLGLAKKKPVSDWFTGKRLGYLMLMVNAFSCRRRFRDQLFFLIVCLLMFILGPCRT